MAKIRWRFASLSGLESVDMRAYLILYDIERQNRKFETGEKIREEDPVAYM